MLDSIKQFFIDAWRIARGHLDPDRDWRSVDKIQHLAGGFGTRILVGAKEGGWDAIFWSIVIGIVYELGQTDTAKSQKLLGKPGYGIGLVDLAYHVMGVFLASALLAVL